MLITPSYTIFPVGESALTISFGNKISERLNNTVLALFDHLSKNPVTGIVEAIPAYSSLTVVYNVVEIKKQFPGFALAYEYVREKLENILATISITTDERKEIKRIPVCYEHEFGIDLVRIAETLKLSPEEIVNIHVSGNYRVYMLGFLPGFAYMGILDTRLELPRKVLPQPVPGGSIGLAGLQTGIYPFASPGGWHIIGRTPVKMFDADSEQTNYLKTGDTVQFYSISKYEFENY